MCNGRSNESHHIMYHIQVYNVCEKCQKSKNLSPVVESLAMLNVIVQTVVESSNHRCGHAVRLSNS